MPDFQWHVPEAKHSSPDSPGLPGSILIEHAPTPLPSMWDFHSTSGSPASLEGSWGGQAHKRAMDSPGPSRLEGRLQDASSPVLNLPPSPFILGPGLGAGKHVQDSQCLGWREDGPSPAQALKVPCMRSSQSLGWREDVPFPKPRH